MTSRGNLHGIVKSYDHLTVYGSHHERERLRDNEAKKLRSKLRDPFSSTEITDRYLQDRHYGVYVSM